VKGPQCKPEFMQTTEKKQISTQLGPQKINYTESNRLFLFNKQF